MAWPLVLIETLHGISFALPMAAMCTYSAVLAPQGMTATLVGVTQGVYWGLGEMLALFARTQAISDFFIPRLITASENDFCLNNCDAMRFM